MQKRFLLLIFCVANSYAMQNEEVADAILIARARSESIRRVGNRIIEVMENNDVREIDVQLFDYFRQYNSSLANDYRLKNGDTLLHFAVARAKEDVVERFLKEPDIDINVVNQEGFTPLLLSIARANMAIKQKLILAGAKETKKISVENLIRLSPYNK